MAIFEKETPLSAAALGLNLEILNSIILEELFLLKEENERLRFELAALSSVMGSVTAFPQRMRKSEVIPPENARRVFFHQNIRILREQHGRTYEQMAQLYGIPSDVWMTYEGKRLPSADLLIAISKSFGVCVSDLLHKNLSECATHPTADAHCVPGGAGFKASTLPSENVMIERN